MARLAHDDPIIIEKTISLCETILARPGFSSVRDSVAAFMQDDWARELYASLTQIGSDLRHKQHHGEPLGDDEIAAFENARRELEGHPLADAFFDAQQQLRRLEATLHAYVTQTLQLGRVPEESDFEGESCGPSCGCHDHAHAE